MELFLISPYDGKDWLDDEVAQHSPIPRVRQFLGGRWDRAKEFQPDVKAYFGASERRVLVMRFKAGTTVEEAHRILGTIREGREDRS